MLKRCVTVGALTLISFSQSSAGAPPKGEKIFWDHWYTVTVEKDHTQYYNEKIEMKEGKLGCFQKVWKKEEGYINEEQLGSFAADPEKLIPLFFNFHSTYRTTETTIDGTFSDGKTLTVKAKQGDKELPSIKKVIPSQAFLQCFFPLWIGRQTSKMKEGKSLSFLTLFEDNLDIGFKPIVGRIRMEPKDEIAKKSKTLKYAVSLDNGANMNWWVEGSGAMFRIEAENPHRVFERVTKETASHFLE